MNSIGRVIIAIAVIGTGVSITVQGLKAYLRILSTHCIPTADFCPRLNGTPDLILAVLGILAVCLAAVLLYTELFHQQKITSEEFEPVFPEI